ncbi:enoyl-CoA hydratase-related protein [Nocardioides sp. 616]|uniref:enoyl-CoA hydratase-related protein n=1 Tax=Nocardioides sp. 616 TaxID=2268090 RepID=UPI0013B3B55D|nr:enoyl-CoA hydratase-related protein [Nocardioides sp. 616]
MTGARLSAAAAEAVTLTVEDGVGIITLNRPDRLNAMDPAMQEGLPARLHQAADDDEIRVILLTGAGRGFCAGADLEVLSGLGDGDKVEMPGREFLVARTIAKPVIGVVNGACAGIGLVFALACDLRFSTREAKFGTGFARRGLVAEQGLAWLLSSLVGHSRALDLLFTSRVITGEEAHALGMVDQLHDEADLLPAAIRYARNLVENSSAVSMGVIKWQAQRAQESTLWEALDDADEITTRSLAGRDFVTTGATLARDARPEYLPIPQGRLGEKPPVELIPPAP